ncbi:MAG: hypothetical protein IJW64_03430 [Clostridia bacterium]|nr:hypothetical protein [Clostridia bacterium]
MEKIFKTDLIKNYLEQNNLTEKDFCNLCKISETALSLIWQHDSEIELLCLFKIAKKLNL